MESVALSADWVIFGIHVGHTGAFRVFASDELTWSELSYKAVEYSQYPGLIENNEVRLNVTMDGYTVATGESYAEAMENLFAEWAPKKREITQ